MRKHKLVLDNIYHIYNRGVEKRHIFTDHNDYKRFILNLTLFNDQRPVLNLGRFYKSEHMVNSFSQGNDRRKPLVDILAFCLMPNHYHLLLKPVVENGITEFMRKLGTGYVNYFNLKYGRVGTLFQGKFKSVLIGDESQFLYISHYIHLNPLDLITPRWRENGIKDKKQAIKFLDDYQWSSYSDYRGSQFYPFILNKNTIVEYFGDGDDYSKNFYEFINDLDFISTSDLLIDNRS